MPDGSQTVYEWILIIVGETIAQAQYHALIDQICARFFWSSFCLLFVKDVQVQVHIVLFQVQIGKWNSASHQYLAY